MLNLRRNIIKVSTVTVVIVLFCFFSSLPTFSAYDFEQKTIPVPTFGPQDGSNLIQFFKDVLNYEDPGEDSEYNDGVTSSEESPGGDQFGRTFNDEDTFTTAYNVEVRNNEALNEIFNEVAMKVGVPAAILRAIASTECPTTFNLSDEDVEKFSAPGGAIPFCNDADPPNYSDGPMQFLPSTWPMFANAVKKYGGYTHKPNVSNIRDSIYAAAMLLKEHAYISETGSSTGRWTQQDVTNAIACYNAGKCKNENVNYSALSNHVRKYVDSVWRYYSTVLMQDFN